MYRILVADDESMIREGIKCLFDYEALGFTICGEAADGSQAYSQILDLQPDVVLMDIRMPGMTGLEVVEKLRGQGYTGRIVIVSSFTDFHYAQEAIRHGVQSYITKPIDEDELEKILRQFKDDLDREQQESNASALYRRKAHESIIREILKGRSDLRQSELADLRLNADRYQVAICEKYSDDSTDYASQLDSLFKYPNRENSAYDHITFHNNEVYLLKGSTVIQTFLDRLNRDFAVNSLFVTLGRPVSTLEDIHLSYQDAAQLKQRRFFCSESLHVLDQTCLPLGESRAPVIDSALVQEYADALLSRIQSFNRKAMAQTMQELQQKLTESADTIEAIKMFLVSVYIQVKNQMLHLYPNDMAPFASTTGLIGSIEKSIYLSQIIALIQNRFDTIISALGTSNRDTVLDEILHYIHHNYASNITLEDISQLFGYNRSYLGKIFSKKMGQNFNSYIDQVRIERSKEMLLSDDAKVYSIAARVGYKNVDYFHIKFKKYVGISPAEYRKRYKDQPQLCSPEGNTEKGPLF